MYKRMLAVCTIAVLAMVASGCVLPPMPQLSPTPLPTATPAPPGQWPPSTIGTIASSQVSVVATGTARILEGDEKLRPLHLLAEKYAKGPVADMPADSVGRTRVVEITIDEVSGKKNEKKS